jgi:hypothetical protein
MKGRRTAAMLCVLLGHALVVLALRNLMRAELRAAQEPESSFATELFFIEPRDEPAERAPPLEAPRLATPRLPAPDAAAIASTEAAPPPGESTAITPRGFIDWPVEGRKSAERIVAEEIEAERVAKMFAGPQGTWASLTKRQQSELRKFRWKPGVDGLERDERGQTIYRLNSRCVLVNFLFIGCALGAKPPAYGDLFKDMQLYFDEQRLPKTNEGNGREPESMRPPYWSKPLGEKDP